MNSTIDIGKMATVDENIQVILSSSGSDYSENRTAEYLRKIENAFSEIIGKTVIDHQTYSRFVLSLPSDLACRLRMVPDYNLVSRMSHLYAMYSMISSGEKIAMIDDYSIVSIEGSNKNVRFDCDLVIQASGTNDLIFIDFTSSGNIELINTKYNIIVSNIKSSNYSNSIAYVQTFERKNIKVDIRSSFESNEPGTAGLRIMDMITRQNKPIIDKVMKQMQDVYYMSNSEIAKMDNANAPGDYKDYEFNEDVISKSAELVQTHKDRESVLFLKELHDIDSSRFPYFKELYNLSKKSHKLKKLVPIEGAVVFESRDLQSNLAKLEDNWLCKALHAATMTESVVAIDDSDNITFLSEFPCNPNDDVLPVLLKYKACMKQKKGHVFCIKFNPAYVDEKLRRVLTHESTYKEKHMFENSMLPMEDQVMEFVSSSIEDYSDDHNSFTSISLEQPKDSIWKKMQTISALASNDLENMGRTTCAMFDNYVAMMEKMYLGSCLSHYYEVNKSILASLKVSPGSSEYYVGVNGSYESVTIVKMSSTLDSFSKTNYSVISRLERSTSKRRVRLDGTVSNGIYFSKFYSTDPMILSQNLKMPMVISALATWEIENNMTQGSIESGKTPQIILDSALHSLVNRDQFAQASEQVRYFYMSAIGYGGSVSDIAEKTTFMFTRHSWENLFLLRSFKMAACLNVLSASKQLPRIEDHLNKELSVAFPHTMYPSKSFSQTISSMYVCNVYNKFRAFHEVAASICYNDILDELEIYKSRVNEDENSVSGISPMLLSIFTNSEVDALDYMMSDNFVADEVEFNISLAAIKSKRYSGSMSYIMGATLANSETSDAVLDNVYHKLSFGPIEACTMKGSMDKGPAVESGQGVRAASSILEEIIRGYNLEPKSVNKSVLGAANLFDQMALDTKSFSIFMFVLMQFCLIVDAYRYRLTDKDQKGHREISVLNVVFRMGGLFVETISRELSHVVGDTDIVHKPNKDKIIEDSVKEAFDESAKKAGSSCFDNSDQKRWGPNHNMNFFAYMLTPMLRKEPGLMRLVIKVFDKVFDKRAKFPEPLINLIMNKKVRQSNSEPIQKFIDRCAAKMDNKIFETILPMGMCQGIFHDTSSVAHAMKAKSAIAIVNNINSDIRYSSLTTSDDAEGIIKMPGGTDVIEAVKMIHCVGLRVGNLFNIVRSNPKSAFNFHIAELNSIFFKKGKMATPSLKQRISKLDVGNGVNHVEDYLSIMSSSANYMASGGSYMGTYIITIMNFVMHTEQWLRWDFAKSDNYYKPVELGGFPVIEPISTLLSGGISNLYLRSSHILSPENYSRLITNTLLCPPERIALSDFARSGSEKVKASYATEDLTVFKGTGPFGLFQTVRTDRKLSVFERRHGISKWIIPEDFANIDRKSSLGPDFLFTIFRNTSVNTLDSSLGVNSYYIRMAEPWVSYDRNCFIVSKNSPMAPTLGGEGSRISHRQVRDKFMAFSLPAASVELEIAFRRCIRHAEFEVMETQLTVRLTDARSLMEFLKEQEAESFRSSVTSPSIQTITLRGQSASDSDAYFLSIIKAMSGQKSKRLINEFRRSKVAYDSIMIQEPREPVGLLDTIVFADNAVSLYNKFVRRDTKMIIPNNVDDMRQLCLDILKNKFTEKMGIVTTGTLDMSEERSKPYAYTKWYQELLKMSEKREKHIAESVLAGKENNLQLIGISTPRGLITSRDMFEIGDSRLPEKTVLISSNNKGGFVNTVRNWLAAKVKFSMDRDTINNFIKGRLTFAHDYFVEKNVFMRNPKHQYLKVTCKSSPSTHFIKTIMSNERGRLTTSYEHTFIFRDNINRASPLAESTFHDKNEKWISNLVKGINSVTNVEPGRWYNISSESSSSLRSTGYRKTINERDKFRFMYITPSSEMSVKTNSESLTVMMSIGDFEFPVTYVMPAEVDDMRPRIQLTDMDFKVATRFYSHLVKETRNFNRLSLMRKPVMKQVIDYILVETTSSTEDVVIERYMRTRKLAVITSDQMDIVRTMLVNNREIGVHFSSHRFTTSLLNLGKRRESNHTFFSRRITGERVNYESEDMSGESDNDELIALGTIGEAFVTNDDSNDEIVRPNYLSNDNNDNGIEQNNKISTEDDIQREIERARDSEIRWSDEPADAILSVQTMEDVNLFSDSDSELVSSTNDVELTNDNELTSSPIPSVTIGESTGDVIEMSAANALNDLFGSMMANTTFDEIFDVDEDSETEATTSGGKILDTIDDLFKRTMETTYGKIKDEKDSALKSIVTGHTVDGNLETARPMIKYLKGWLDSVGKMREYDFIDSQSTNVSKITSVYLMMDNMGVLDMTFPLTQMFGVNHLDLPIELSALTVINEMYM